MVSATALCASNASMSRNCSSAGRAGRRSASCGRRRRCAGWCPRSRPPRPPALTGASPRNRAVTPVSVSCQDGCGPRRGEAAGGGEHGEAQHDGGRRSRDLMAGERTRSPADRHGSNPVRDTGGNGRDIGGQRSGSLLPGDSPPGEARLGFRRPATGGPGPRGAGGPRAGPFHGGTKARETAKVPAALRPGLRTEAPMGCTTTTRTSTAEQTDAEPTLHDNYGPEARYAVAREAELPTTKWEEEIARGLRARPAGRRLHRGPAHPDVLPRRAAALRRHQHLPQGALRRGRAALRRVRRRGAGRAVRRRHHLPLRHPVRAAGHPQDLRAVRPVQLRARRRPARVDHHRRPRRHLHHPGQHREDVRPDLQGRRRTSTQSGAFPVVLGGDHSIGYPTVRGVAEHLHGQPRHHPLRPARRHPGDRPRRADAHHAVVPRHGHPERAAEEPGADRHRRLAGAPARA